MRDHDRRGDRRSERRRRHNGCQGRRCEQARARTFARTFARTHARTQPLARAWLRSNSTAIFDDAIATAQNADVVVLVLGNDRSQVVVSAVRTASRVMRLHRRSFVALLVERNERMLHRVATCCTVLHHGATCRCVRSGGCAGARGNRPAEQLPRGAAVTVRRGGVGTRQADAACDGEWRHARDRAARRAVRRFAT